MPRLDNVPPFSVFFFLFFRLNFLPRSLAAHPPRLIFTLTFVILGGQDEAICYAETATSPDDRKFANHLININGDEVLNKRKVYERSRANAWSNEDSILKLATAIMKENVEMKKKFGIDAIEVSYVVLSNQSSPLSKLQYISITLHQLLITFSLNGQIKCYLAYTTTTTTTTTVILPYTSRCIKVYIRMILAIISTNDKCQTMTTYVTT